MKKTLYILVALFLTNIMLFAQDVPAPAPQQSMRIIISGARLHIGNGQVIENGIIEFEKGIITKVGPAGTVVNTEGANVIDAKGKDVYPGLIAPATCLGLIEIGAVRATNDRAEVGNMNPNVRAAIAYNTDSRITPTVRFNGVLTAQVVPDGGRITGTSCVMQLDAWNWEDAVIKEDGIWVNWPSLYSYSGWWAEPGNYEKNKEYPNQVRELRDFLVEAKAYCNSTSITKKNLKFEAMRGLFAGKANMYIRVDAAKEMLEAIAFAEEMGIKPVLVGAYDSWQIADVLAKKNIPVILDKCHALPARQDDDIEQNYKTPGILQKAGVLFAISIAGSWETRNLAFEAGTASTYGLTKEEALAAVSANAAKILGLGNSLGTLEVGKSATLLINSGDLLNMNSSKPEMAFIQGRKISLGNKQKDLFDKFSAKYGLH